MKIHDCEQRSEAWEKIRRGRPTASRFSDIVTAAKCELSKSAKGYMHELIAECFDTDLTGGFNGNAWTDRGNLWEPDARKAYAEITGYDVREVGFVTQDNGIIGCSPDGLCYRDGVPFKGPEIKCPAPKKFVEIVANGVLPDEYRAQIHGEMYVTGLPAWDFFAYCPGMKPFLLTVHADDYTAKLGAAVEQFVIEYAALRARLLPLLRIQPPSAE